MSKTTNANVEFHPMRMRGPEADLSDISFVVNENDAKSERRRKSRTHQSFKDEANINNIVNRYKRTGVLVEPGKIRSYRQAQFGDFSDVTDLTATLSRLDDAQLRFMALPAKVRERFNNDVAQLLDFVQDDANYDEAIELGLLPPRKDGMDDVQATVKKKAQAMANYEIAKRELEKLDENAVSNKKVSNIKTTAKNNTGDTE